MCRRAITLGGDIVVGDMTDGDIMVGDIVFMDRIMTHITTHTIAPTTIHMGGTIGRAHL